MNKVWTKEEESYLKENYFDILNVDLALTLSRTTVSIQKKASALGLTKSKILLSITKSNARIGDKCCSWKGGKKYNNQGYVLISKRGYPGTDRNGYMLEHRYVMEQKLGRRLTEDEIVHHKNEVKDDNSPDNLYVENRGKHTIRHHLGKSLSNEIKEIISKIAKERFKCKESHPSYKSVDVKKLVELRKQGLTIEQICKIYGICRKTYYNKIKGEVA